MEENKEQTFLEEVTSYLQSKNFTEESPEVFKLQRTITQPGATMVINGQQIQQPGQEMIHTVKVEFFGPGVIEEGTGHEDHFEIIRFKAEDTVSGSKDSQMFEHMEGFYSGELNRFKEMLEKFGI